VSMMAVAILFALIAASDSSRGIAMYRQRQFEAAEAEFQRVLVRSPRDTTARLYLGDTNDNDELIYVTQFLAVDRPGVLIGRDDYKEGRVTVISVADNHVVREVVLNPIAETGFLSNGSALKQIPATNPPTFTVHTMGINGSYVVWTLPRGPANIKRISSRLQPNFQ